MDVATFLERALGIVHRATINPGAIFLALIVPVLVVTVFDRRIRRPPR